MSERRYTLKVRPGCADRALGVADDFLKRYPDHYSKVHPERRGVGYKLTTGEVFYVFGDSDHVRVHQSDA